jgi:uncharacterized protein (TIGR03437 family)
MPRRAHFLPRIRYIALLFSAASCLLHAQVITTFAGTDWLPHLDGVVATQAPLGAVAGFGLTLDPQGRPVIADAGNNVVVRVEPSGTLTVIAGNGIPGSTGDGGPATGASLGLSATVYNPSVAYDSQGNLYIGAGNTIRRVDRNGVIRTFAGNGSFTRSGDYGPAINAGIVGPLSMVFDSFGNLYAAEQYTVRKITPAGIITTVAGTGAAGYSGDGGPATGATFAGIAGLAVDPQGNLFVADQSNNRVREITTDGKITTFAGTGQSGRDVDGLPATASRLKTPYGLAVGPDGLYIADENNFLVRRVGSDGKMITVAGNGQFSFGGDGGLAIQAGLGQVGGVAVDAKATLYLLDVDFGYLRRVDSQAIITTAAGTGAYRADPDGIPAATGYLLAPRGMAFDRGGNLYVADSGLSRIRRITPNGIMTTFAGNGERQMPANGATAVATGFNNVDAVVVDSQGNVYAAPSGGATWQIVKIDTQGIVRTLAAGPFAVSALAIDQHDVLYGASMMNNTVYRFAPDGTPTILAGNGTSGFGGDGGPATKAVLKAPNDIFVDTLGNVYISDGGNARIRRIAPDGTITTVAGGGSAGTQSDNIPATSAGLSFPRGVVADPSGNIYIADFGDNRVRKVSPSGIITTVAGNRIPGFSGDGGPPLAASLYQPDRVAVDSAGRLFISEFFNNRIRLVTPVAPVFQLSSTSVSLSASSGGAIPDPAHVTVGSSVAGLTFSVSMSTADQGSWLSATPAAGSVPSSLAISADPSTLAAGVYTGTVTVTAPLASPPSRTIAVSFAVAAAVKAKLAVEPGSLTFTSSLSSSAATRQIKIENAGDGQLPFTVSASSAPAGWLSVAPASGAATPSAPGVVTVQADASKLSPGTYSGRVTVMSPATGESFGIPVTFAVTENDASIVLSQTGLTFTAVAGAGVSPPQTFGVLNAGKGIMPWTAQLAGDGNLGWLSVTPTSGSTDASSLKVPLVTVAVNAQGLGQGVYYQSIQVAAPNAANSPQSLLVVLNVLPPGSSPGPVVNPSGLIFTGVAGDTIDSSQTALVTNLTGRPTQFTSGTVTSDNSGWFRSTPSTASIAGSAAAPIVIQPVTTGLSPGIRRGVVTLLFDDGSVRNVNLLLLLLANSGPSNRAPASPRGAAGCSPTKLIIVLSSESSGLIGSVYFPAALESKIVDDCAQPVTSGTVTVSFSNGDAPISLVPLGDGTWAQTWVPQHPATAVTLTLSASAGGIAGTATAVASVGGTSQPPPVVAPGGVVNSAGSAQLAAVAPGSLISIYGDRLASTAAPSPTLPLGINLAGTSVLLAGQSLPLLFVSSRQINAIVPYDLHPNAQYFLLVQNGNSYSAPQPVTIATSNPAIFSQDASGMGPGLIADANGQLISASNPAHAGDVVVVYAAGLGPVNPGVDAASGTPTDHLEPTMNPVSVSVGGVAAQVSFSGLTPGFVGLYQVNVAIPPGVSPGISVPVALTSLGQTSNTVTTVVK